jgi:hypothetical protein
MIACKKTVIVLVIVLAILFFLFCPFLAGEVHSTGKGYFNSSMESQSRHSFSRWMVL